MSVLVKICGITNLDDAMSAVEFGADFIGFNFYPDSPRYIAPPFAKEITGEMPSAVGKVGIFVNEDSRKVSDLAIDLSLDYLQFHGDETPEYCNAFGRPWFKAFRLKDDKALLEIPYYHSEWLLVDAHVEKIFGGSGITSNWDLARKAKSCGLLFLSGGLNPGNVEVALKAVGPYAVDTASGVESSPGVKDVYKMEEFISRVKMFDSVP